MDEQRQKGTGESEREIVFSRAVKAGKRIYYLDVKKSRRGEMFLAITESKKVVNGEGDEAMVSFEKHKIFLYPEDFDKFTDALGEVIGFIQAEQPGDGSGDENSGNSTQKESSGVEDLKVDIDFGV